MSLQITTGAGSLVALGFSLGDLATLWSLGRKVGNWMTAVSGDENLLKILDQDELDILRRRGLIDIDRFNKMWGSTMALLGPNGMPAVFAGEDAEKCLEKLGRFTAVMVAIVAALDAFAPDHVIRPLLRNVLLELLRASEYGEDILASQCADRINAWRSVSRLRKLSTKAEGVRAQLLSQNYIVDGLMPLGDSPLMVDFLVWLLTGSTDTYTTPSSDVAGVATCLSKLGIDILSVGGLGEMPMDTPCRLKYCPETIYHRAGKKALSPSDKLSRIASTTVSLTCPEESLTKFPVDYSTANRCRQAWSSGQEAAKFVGCLPTVSLVGTQDDIWFAFYDKGSEPGRKQVEIQAMASAHAFVVNKELIRALELVFQHEPVDNLKWLMEQTIESAKTATQVWNSKFKDTSKINAYTVFQAFFMGYYYEIFLGLVDTSALQMQTVDGAWGFRSAHFLTSMRALHQPSENDAVPRFRSLRREDVISILTSLLFSSPKPFNQTKRGTFNKENWCLGVIGKRALVVRSLLKPCKTIRDIGSFVLLDVDVSGIPTDSKGIIRPGLEENSPRVLDFKTSESIDRTMTMRAKANDQDDATFHIEADWEGNPEHMLLCVRYNGRRIGTINPALADSAFCQSMVRPVSKPSSNQNVAFVHMTASELVNGHPIPAHNLNNPVLIGVAERPRLQYLAVTWLASQYGSVRMASNCLKTAAGEAKEYAEGIHSNSAIIVCGDGLKTCVHIDDWIPERIDKDIVKDIRRGGGIRPSRSKRVNLLGDGDSNSD
jgi:hypothetical protein